MFIALFSHSTNNHYFCKEDCTQTVWENFFCYIFLSVVMGGVFSWVVVSRREKQCIRECKAMGNVLEMGQMGLAKISVGIFFCLYLLLLSWMISLWGG